MPSVPSKFYCTDREHKLASLQLQSRLLHLQCVQWIHVHSVCGRTVLGVAGISRMRAMQLRHVFNSWGIDMRQLFAKLHFVYVEDNLHLQCGLLGAC